MKNRNNTWTIIRKEFARFFGDRQLVFTTVIMPGLLIYLIYSLMGVGIRNMETHGEQDVVTVRVENMPQSVAPILSSLDSSIVPCRLRRTCGRLRPHGRTACTQCGDLLQLRQQRLRPCVHHHGDSSQRI